MTQPKYSKGNEMVQVYIATAIAFALIGIMAHLEGRSSQRGTDADGRSWFITKGSAGYIGGEFIEE